MTTSAEKMMSVLTLASKLYFKLSAVGADSLKESGVSPGQRALMEDVSRLGPQSIGALAAMRPVAKQYVQKLVSDLVEIGFAELTPNPADGRSKLVELTAAGRDRLETWRRADLKRLEAFASTIPDRDIDRALSVLTAAHAALQDEVARLQTKEASAKTSADGAKRRVR
ncbi:MAG: MarR family winged helix-turn-helix transcriptional regulator [Pseudomonadota bacterium]